MSFKKISLVACVAVMCAAAGSRSALAQSFVLDSRTEFTFNFPVELPGVTLPPGNYIFRFVDLNTGRKVMQVTANDRSHKQYGFFVTITTQRAEASDEAEVRLIEGPAGAVRAIRSWWYPGDSIGREFIYPKEQARRLALAGNTSVLTTNGKRVSAADLPAATGVDASSSSKGGK